MKIRILLNKMKSAAKSGVALVVVTAIGLTAAGAVTGTDAYVQTDLLAIWDGIENAGSSRQHDSAITEWKDVIGDRAFALTGVTIERDGLVFSGSGASSRGVLSADDATATFVAAGSGTMEIVLEPDEESEVNQRLALQGPTSNNAGLSIGYGKDGRIYFQNLKDLPGISYDWRGEANTFSVRYSKSVAVTDGSGVFRNGELVPENLYPGPTDFWGASDSKAYVGGRASGADGFVGKICCVRLYSRQLTAEEIAANAEVDRIRYREHGRIEIVGDPENYGSPTPDYGKFVPTDGEVIDFNVGETVVEGVNYRALCVGHRVLHSNDDGGWVQEGEDSSETAFSYAYDGIGSRRVEWIWQIRHPPCVAEPELVTARRMSAEFVVYVSGFGYDDYGSRLSIVWGTDAQQLDQTNAVATVFAIGDYRAHLTRTKSVDYYVQSVLEKLDADGNVVSAVVSDVVLLPADKVDDEAYGSKGYVTDGLVAWWDGIYNGGLSKTFEATPTEWRDVVGNVAFSVVGYAPSETRDSMAFSGSAGVYGVLSAQDTADTFGRCSNGTLEIVARGNKSDRACIALRGSDTSGIAFGPAGDTATTLSFITSTKVKPTIRGDWNERRTFAVRYEGASPKDAFVDGAPVSWVTDKQDNWGNGGDANRAFVGNRNGASSQYSMDGEICAIRLYSRQLTDDEVAANSRVDDVRFRWQLVNLNSLEITGNPGEYGLVTPAYGRQSDLKAGESIVC